MRQASKTKEYGNGPTTAPLVLALLFALLVFPTATKAATAQDPTAALRQALSAKSEPFIRDDGGFSLSGRLFTGRSSGTAPLVNRGINGLGLVGEATGDRFAELEGDQRVHAFLLDSSYDFAYDFGTGLPLSPYVEIGGGLALHETPGIATLQPSANSAAMVPLFRIGGGIVYQLGTDWNLSLNYKAGFAGRNTQAMQFTGRGQEQVDVQLMDMGLKFRF